MKMKLIAISAVLVFLLLAMPGALEVPSARGHSGDVLSAWAYVTPTIDGAISPGEWDDAHVATFTLTYNGESHPTTLYVKNDDANLYVAAVVEGDDYNNMDYFELTFDNDHDGSWWEDGDDLWGIKGDGLLTDGFFSAATGSWHRDADSGGSMDTIGGAYHTNPGGVGDYYFEFYHPLDTGDTGHDFSLSIGDTVGFLVKWLDWDIGRSSYWPAPLADIIIASPPEAPPPVGGVILPVQTLALLAPYIIMLIVVAATAIGLTAALKKRML
mgnify:CR=1 FL=1